jgi:hypothetical protein
MDEGSIKRELGDAVTVHVVPRAIRADETVLALAVSEDTFVISDDRFAEFKDKLPVQERRIIHHEVVDGHVLSTTWTST